MSSILQNTSSLQVTAFLFLLMCCILVLVFLSPSSKINDGTYLFLSAVTTIILQLTLLLQHVNAGLHCMVNDACYIVYIYRSLVYPALMRKGKPTPMIVFLIAAVICLLNGFMQTRYLLLFALYPDDWVTSVTFLCGKVIG